MDAVAHENTASMDAVFHTASMDAV